MFELTLESDLSQLEEIEKNTEKRIAKAVVKTAFLLQTEARILAPVDTGALRNGIHALTYGGATKTGPYVPSTPYEAFVVATAAYSLSVETGYFVARSRERKRMSKTKKGSVLSPVSRVGSQQTGTWVSGRWYMARAVEAVRPRFVLFLKEALEGK